MPRTKRYTRRTRRRFGRKRYGRKKTTTRAPTATIGRQINHGFPRMIKFTHRYVDVLVVASTSGVPNSYKFSCNGMFDPNISGTGRQPMAFDNMTAVYDHYCVIGSKIKFKVSPTSDLNPASFAGIYINDDTSNSPASSAAYVAVADKYIVWAPGGVNTYTLTSKWSANKMFGKSVLANTDLQGTATANPAEQSYFTLFVGALDELSNTSFSAIVDIEYIAIWKEPKDLDLS